MNIKIENTIYSGAVPMQSETLFPGILNDPSGWEGWVFLFIGIAFIALCAWFMWMYFSCKSTADSLLARTESHSAWSFIGFWGRYRGAILAFTSAVFLILGGYFIFGGLTGSMVVSGLA